MNFKKYLSTEIDDFISENKLKPKASIIEKPIKEVRERTSRQDGHDQYKTNDKILVDKQVQLALSDDNKSDNGISQNNHDELTKNEYIITEKFPKLKIISPTGQLNNKTYVILEGLNEKYEGGIYILDQHAASERINKEFFMKVCDDAKKSCQQLISPLKIELSPSEKSFLEENINEIKMLGFNFESFGGNTFILRDIPTIMDKIPPTNIVKDIISDITKIGKDKSFSLVKEEIINYLACHKSIRGGDALSMKDIKKLLVDLSRANDPFHCAHGRPTLKFISFKELDKLFKRTG